MNRYQILLPSDIDMDVGLPKNSEWGPPLWDILHSVLERLGTSTHEYILNDQMRELKYVIRAIDTIMPCAMCKKHYQEWKATHSIEALPQTPHEFFKAMREWVFQLHLFVNTSRQVENSFTMDMLSERYKKILLKQKWEELDPLLKKAVAMGAVDFTALRSFRVHILFLIRLVL